MKLARVIVATVSIGFLLMISGTNTVHAATCIGADPCRACKNCHYCGFCAKRGGACGVCKRR